MNFMPSAKILGLITAIGSAALFAPPVFSQATPAAGSVPPPNLGDAPKAPADVSGLPGRGPRPLDVTGGFNVNTDSREQVREFYNAVYTSSEGVAMDSTAVTTNCFPGTNSTAFQNATLRRINWFRAMGGIPAAITFDSNESAKDQAGALMMSANNTLQHVGIPPTWSCFTTDGTNAAANSNLALGSDGADAITGFIWDFGANNTEVGHRRWILYPQTQVMAAGDVPAESGFSAANATWVFDGNYGGPRPATSQPFVSWPPAGFVPYQLVFPQWSFALSNADFSAATVSMTSNGAPVTVSIQPYLTGYGEDTLVWVPMGLDATSEGTTFPFSGTDTVYSITVTNIVAPGGSIVGFTYTVTLFDPAVPGTDYVATVVVGTNTPYLNTGNPYACVPIANPNTTGYQWLTAQTTNGNLTDNATNGLTNFTISPPPIYPVITNPPTGAGKCFHLCHTNPVSQYLQLNEALLPATNTTLLFKSLLGYAFTNEIAHAQVSVDGGANWQDLFMEAGCYDGNGGASQCETTFTAHSYSLSNFAGQLTLVRFVYAFNNGGYFTGNDPYLGWCLENIVVTNVQQIVGMVTNSTATTNFTFTPAQAGNYALAAAPVLFTQFPLGWGPFKLVTAITNPNPTIVLGQPVLTNNQVLLNFTVSGSATTFHLLQSAQLNLTWTTNTTATFTTNIPGSSYRYAATNNAPIQFYRIQTP
jgi:hypothetical protein